LSPIAKKAASRFSLVDLQRRVVRYVRISVTDRCNYRCAYCVPADGIGAVGRDELLRFMEIERLARIFVSMGITRIRLTGGEPLLRHQLPRLVERLAAVEGIRDLTLTTNGWLLSKYAQKLADVGLQRVTVSLDSHDDAVFGAMNGRGFGTGRVFEGIEAADAVGLRPIKINSVVERGVNEESIVPLARRFKGTGHILRFIEFMDVGTLNDWNRAKVVPAREILDRVGTEFPLEPADPNYSGEVAQRWRYADGSGEIGIVASVTSPFCRECHRARLTIEGRLVTCLFAAGGVDLRGPLREGASDEALRELISGAWRRRTDRYSEERVAQTGRDGCTPHRGRIEMYQVGG